MDYIGDVYRRERSGEDDPNAVSAHPSRLPTPTEMKFYEHTNDERQVVALAQVCSLSEDATEAQVKEAVLRSLTAALERNGTVRSGRVCRWAET